MSATTWSPLISNCHCYAMPGFPGLGRCAHSSVGMAPCGECELRWADLALPCGTSLPLTGTGGAARVGVGGAVLASGAAGVAGAVLDAGAGGGPGAITKTGCPPKPTKG